MPADDGLHRVNVADQAYRASGRQTPAGRRGPAAAELQRSRSAVLQPPRTDLGRRSPEDVKSPMIGGRQAAADAKKKPSSATDANGRLPQTGAVPRGKNTREMSRR